MEKELECENFFHHPLALLCVANSEGKFLKLSSLWQEVTGYTLKELKTKPIIEFIHPEDFEATLEEFDVLETTGRGTPGFRNRHIRKDGHIIYLEWRSVRLNGWYYASAHDVTHLLKS